MLKRFGLLFFILILAGVLSYGQATPVEEGSALNVGRTATLDVEATTAFGWDFDNNSTGLETKVGMDLIFPLFGRADRGVTQSDYDTPGVRLSIKNASFNWWNIYSTRGGNYEQDNFNTWTARPLYLTFDDLFADVVWQNYFLRLAGTTTVMRVDTTSLRTIFDDVIDARDRIYVAENQALWRDERYNIQNFPLINRLYNDRDLVDVDYRGKISGSLALGAEWERVSVAVKAASRQNGQDNDANAWIFGADVNAVPLRDALATGDRLKVGVTGMGSVNYEVVDETGEAPGPYKDFIAAGVSVEYQLPLTEDLVLTPYVGFDFAYDRTNEESGWEVGGGLLFYTRGYDTRVSYRVLDYADVIPIGASVALNMDNDKCANLILSWFDPAGPRSMLPNFGGFLQLEVSDLMGEKYVEDGMDFAVLAQFEYSIDQKVTPYIRGGYGSEQSGNAKTGNIAISGALGFFLTPIHFFSLDLRYQLNILQTTEETTVDKGQFYAVFTIRM